MLRKFLIVFLIASPLRMAAQQEGSPAFGKPRHTFACPLSSRDTVIHLPHRFVLQGSETLLVDSTRKLVPGFDYALHPSQGVVSISSELLATIAADSGSHRLTVTYESFPYQFRPGYSLHEVRNRSDSLPLRDQGKGVTPSRFTADDIFGSGLQKNGSIFRALTVGSNRDLTLNSGFRMQLAGKLSPELDLVAALTDENVPIQPEGTTQTLQELDKVFVQLRNPLYGATLGDFVYDADGRDAGEFGRLTRKLQGATGSARLNNVFDAGSSVSLTATGATTRGRFTSNQIQGVEGNQGPYRLTGEEASRRPIVIAGTERVYVNGLLMTRGETNDYTIDYSTGEVLFSPRRMITNASRITVDFEYTDRQFVRNLVGASGRLSALDNSLKIFTSVTQEADDPDSPVDIELPDTLRSIIAASGSERFLASINGARFVGLDSTTELPKGQYILRDTLLAGKRRPFFVYSPGDPRALYAVTFSFVESVPKDSLGYDRLGSAGFVAAGLGRGSYLPLQFLPVPELHQVLSGRASYSPRPELSMSAEYAYSHNNSNRFATGTEVEKSGAAYKFDVRFEPKEIKIGEMNFGALALHLSDRFVDRRFSSLDRYNEVEFARNWNIEGAGGGDEEIREVSLAYYPLRSVEVSAGYGLLERTGSVRSTKMSLRGSYTDSLAPAVSYSSEILDSEDFWIKSRSKWIRQSGNVSYEIGALQPALRIEMEERRENSSDLDSLQGNSFRFLEVAPGISLLRTGPVHASAEVRIRSEDSASTGTFMRAIRSVTQLYDVQLREWRSLSGSVSIALRKADLSSTFATTGDVALNTVLVRSQARYGPFQRSIDMDVLYEFARERSAAMKRVFVRVPKGTGNYLYIGDLNQNGLPDENEFEQTRFDGDYITIYVADEKLVPVSDVKAGLRLRLIPARIMTGNVGFWGTVVRRLTTETVARVEERSMEPESKMIYLLDLSRFLRDETTITGTQLFTQDVFFNESDPSFMVRLRFNERRGLLRLIGAGERSYVKERSLRIRAQLLKEIGNQTEYINRTDRLATVIDSPRRRDLLSNELKTEFSYRPYSEWEVAIGTAMSNVLNRYAEPAPEASLNNQFLRLTYSLSSLGQLRAEVVREEASVASRIADRASTYPFEFTDGRVIGKTYQWRLAFDYRISQYVQVTVGYDGRKEGLAKPVHNARAEARAFF